MGFWNDFLRSATPALPGGMQIGLQGMAEMQRKKELQAEIARQQEQQAFANMMKQREMDQGQNNWQREFDANNMFKQQQGVDDLSQLMMQGQNMLADNALQRQKFQQVEVPESKARIANLAEPNNRFAAGADPNSPGGGPATGRDYIGEQIQKQAHAAASAAAVDEMSGAFDPIKYQQVYPQMYEFFKKQQPQGVQVDVNGDEQTTDLEAFEALKGFVEQGQEIDWPATMAKYPHLNWAGIKASLGVK